MFQPSNIVLAFLLCLLPALARAQTPQELAGKVKTILAANCYRCHGDTGAAEGGMAYVTDLAKLVERKKVVPRNPAGSKLYKKIASEDDPMPPLTDDDNKPVTQRPSKAEIALVRQWIEAGAPVDAPAVAAAPRTFISDADILAAIAKDLDSADDRARPFLRYFTITHLYNAGLSDDELQTYRGGLSKLVNSLSWGRHVIVPLALDAQKTIFRIDLRDYKWNEQTWRRILAANPYGVTFETAVARAVYGRTRCELPYVRADWFVFAASRPPLYHDVLELPVTDLELEKRLEVDVAEDIRTERVARAGFNGSVVSRNNRMIERHDSPYGSYWKSVDFKKPGANDRKNLFAHPLGPGDDPRFFEQDGGEIIFNLPNGLQAYMLINGKGQRIDKGPTDVVSDPKQEDRAVVNGVSCMSCHVKGMIEKNDQVRDTVLGNAAGYDVNTCELVKALYPTKEKFDALLKDDADRFAAAVEKTQAARTKSEPIVSLSLRFQADLDAPLAAAEAGLTPQKFREIVSRSPVLAPRLGALNIPGGTVQRDVFVAVFGDVVRAIAFGKFRQPEGGADFAAQIGMKFVRIEPGTFMMGSPDGEEGHGKDEMQHQVTLSRPYSMAVHHVTRGQFAAFVADTGYKTDAEKEGHAFAFHDGKFEDVKEASWRNPGFAQQDDHPVVEVSWNDANAFCEWLSAKQGRRCRLPTEAEWEYACRATTTTPFNTGATISTDQANYDGTSTYGAGVKGVYRQATTPVGIFPASKFGLYDMHGNAWQWCYDAYGDYPVGPVTNPTGLEQKPNAPRVLRGGSWTDYPGALSFRLPRRLRA
jgi:formylglycine-generating enzyme required for sulfatase activity/mono/diheme cytochrome c family protein